MFARSVNSRLKPNGAAGLTQTLPPDLLRYISVRGVAQHDGDGRWTKALSEEEWES
jgi:hypothetical protein